jgi:drug efflux transport system ATP-binding protein
MDDVRIRLEQVTKRFGEGPPALDGVSGAVHGGQITGLVGPDGAGKTTLLRLIAGLLGADGGRLEVLGVDPGTQADRIFPLLGYMPQRFGLYEDLTVAENLGLYAELRDIARERRPAVMEELLRFTDLAGFTGRLAGKLSGGMKQKLGLACALMQRPRLLLLDEPSVGVDPISRRELWKLVQGLKAEGVAVIWSTAYLDEAEACDRVLLLDKGKLLFDGPPGELSSRVQGRVYRMTGITGRRRPVLAALLSEPEVLDGGVQGEALRVVTRSGTSPRAPPEAGSSVRVEPVAPRLEDAFIDMLGGGPGGTSRLAEARRPSPESPRPVIEAHGLTKRFGDFVAAKDITFEVKRGEIFGLLGPNGAGKSTTFRMLCGLLRPTSGEGKVAGIDLRRDTAGARARLGYMAQKFSLYGDLSVRQNLEFFAGTYGLEGQRKQEQIALMTESFELGPRLGSTASQLPLGFKQRLALACAVLHEPDALFLDEPTSGVDPITRREFWSHINGLVEKGVAVLVTTHFMEEAEYCDRIALVYRGQSIALGPPDALRARVATRERPDPTMEDAFIELVQRSDAAREAA